MTADVATRRRVLRTPSSRPARGLVGVPSAPDQFVAMIEELDRRGLLSTSSEDSAMARCPAHDDTTPSLSIRRGDKQPVILRCFAGCPAEDVLAALGMRFADISVERAEETDSSPFEDAGIVPTPRPELYDRVYLALLHALPLEPTAHEALVARGLAQDDIAARMYRSIDPDLARAAADKLNGHFTAEDLCGVPGFYPAQDQRQIKGRWQDHRLVARFSCAPGILVPIRRATGEIVGLKVRTEQEGAGRYRYVSSAPFGGPRASGEIHWSGPYEPGAPLRITEGELKADVAASIDGLVTLSAPGVATWRKVVDAIDALPVKPKVLTVAFDMDTPGHGARRKLAAKLLKRGYNVQVALWAGVKGIDDALVAGLDIRYDSAANRPELHPRRQLLTIGDLLQRPRPASLVAGVLDAGAFAVMSGQPGTKKSFVALDIGLSVAAGIPWHQLAVKRGRVVYIAGEGLGGLGSRIAAWMEDRKVTDCPDFRILASAQDLANRKTAKRLVDGLNQFPPVLIVVDTLARNFSGDENSAADMGAFVANIQRLQVQTGATVLVIHHTPKTGKGPRGSGALMGAVDTALGVSIVGGRIVVSAEKQKEMPDDWHIRLRSVEVADSLVLRSSSSGSDADGNDLSSAAERVHEALIAVGGEATRAELLARGVGSSVAGAGVKELEGASMLERRKEGRKVTYCLTRR